MNKNEQEQNIVKYVSNEVFLVSLLELRLRFLTYETSEHDFDPENLIHTFQLLESLAPTYFEEETDLLEPTAAYNRFLEYVKKKEM